MAARTSDDHKLNDTAHLEKPIDIPGSEPGGDVDVPAGYFPVTAEEKAMSRSLNRKLDIYLLPFLSLLYLFNGLDRSNVGNAQTDGRSSSAKLKKTALTDNRLYHGYWSPRQRSELCCLSLLLDFCYLPTNLVSHWTSRGCKTLDPLYDGMLGIHHFSACMDTRTR
jgi:hypothetical protein